MNKEEVEAFDKWAAFYWSWSDEIPSEGQMRLSLDAFEAGINYILKKNF